MKKTAVCFCVVFQTCKNMRILWLIISPVGSDHCSWLGCCPANNTPGPHWRSVSRVVVEEHPPLVSALSSVLQPGVLLTSFFCPTGYQQALVFLFLFFMLETRHLTWWREGSGGAHHRIPVLKGWVQREWKPLSSQVATWRKQKGMVLGEALPR